MGLMRLMGSVLVYILIIDVTSSLGCDSPFKYSAFDDGKKSSRVLYYLSFDSDEFNTYSIF